MVNIIKAAMWYFGLINLFGPWFARPTTTNEFVVLKINPSGKLESRKLLTLLKRLCNEVYTFPLPFAENFSPWAVVPKTCIIAVEGSIELKGEFMKSGIAIRGWNHPNDQKAPTDLESSLSSGNSFELYENVIYRINGNGNFNCTVAIIKIKRSQSVQCSLRQTHQHASWYFKIKKRVNCITDSVCSRFIVTIHPATPAGFNLIKQRGQFQVSNTKMDVFELRRNNNSNDILDIYYGSNSKTPLVMPVSQDSNFLRKETRIEVQHFAGSNFRVLVRSMFLGPKAKNLTKISKRFVNNASSLIVTNIVNNTYPSSGTRKRITEKLLTRFSWNMVPEYSKSVTWQNIDETTSKFYNIQPYEDCSVLTYETWLQTDVINLELHMLFVVSFVVNSSVSQRNFSNIKLDAVPYATNAIVEVNGEPLKFYSEYIFCHRGAVHGCAA